MKRLFLTAFLCALLPFQIWGEDIPKAYGPSSVEPGSKISRARGFFGQSEHLYSGDILNGIYGYGYGLTSFATSPGVSIKLKANQNWTASAQGTKITFETTPDASTTAAEVMSIDDNGNLAVSGSFTGTGDTTINGTTIFPADSHSVGVTTVTPTSTYATWTSTGGALTIQGIVIATPTASTAGQVYIVRSATSSITITDEDTDTSSNVQLGNTTRVLDLGDVIGFVWNGTDWVEMFYSDVSMGFSTGGNVSIGGTLSVTGISAFGNLVGLYSRTEAELKVTTPTVVGQIAYDSTNVAVVIGTGTTNCTDWGQINAGGTAPAGW